MQKWRVFPFLPRYNTMSAGLIKIGSGLISSRRTTPITCHTFYAGLFLHMLFWDSFSRNIFSFSYFVKRTLLKAQKIQPLSNSIQLVAFAQSTTFVLTSFLVIVQFRQYLKTSCFFTGCELLQRKLNTKANPQVSKLVLATARVTPLFLVLTC